ncbi:hypothetical protein DID78_06250 [Candidatus Marinamargulisbacteria bacterium SCGC AG-343-D04]|nr:hypothetical protein DID78_06250 [Candidatus Marinamargulisbacteria bacterium SCGC AG-343-D04]
MFSGKIFRIRSLFTSFSPLLIIGLFVVVSAIIIYSPFIPKNINLNIGDTCIETITAPYYLEFESSQDKLINEDYIQDVKSRIGSVYSINTQINEDIIGNIDLFFDELSSNSIETFSIHITQVLSSDDLLHLKSLDKKTLSSIQFYTLSSINRLLKEGIKEKNTPAIQDDLFSSLQNHSQLTQDIMVKMVMHFIKPNLTIDLEQTNLIVAQALSSINYQKTIFKEGQPIIYESEIVQNHHIEVFQAFNIYQNKANLIPFFGILFVSMFCMLILYQFISVFYSKVHQFKFYLLILLVLLLLIFISRFCIELTILPKYALAYLLIPISISSMVLSILITPNISLLIGSLASILIAIMFDFSYDVFLFLFLSNSFTTFQIFKTFKRSELILSGYFIGAANILIIFSIGFLQGQSHFIWYGINALFAFGNGVFSSMITLAILPYLESFFKITTNQTLLELSNLNHPLLKRLMIDAPGTYQHSLMVANLAEAAADTIKANSILCRVGSYFHDIGKLKRPSFFSENQFSKDNPHDTIAPRISKMVILSHVKEGQDMALKNKLPSIIVDIILQHHGTSLLSLFFNQALSAEKDSQSVDDEFRYPGPKPQTKEAGIIMLADSIEASTRALEKPTPQKIENTINKIFKDKLDDQQLSECPLSLNEIFLIKSTFLNLFKGMSHSRLDYQKEIQKLESQSPDSKIKT